MDTAFRPVARAPRTIEAETADAVDRDDQRHQMLNRIFTRHCLLDVRFEHGAEAFQSAIIELVPQQGYMVLDALSPDDGNLLVDDEQAINVKTRVEGLEVRFQARITGRGGDGRAPYYKVPYPEVIDYPQRRREYRVTVPLDRGIEVRFEGGQGLRWGGEVRDLSPSGFCARLTRGDIDSVDAAQGEQGRCEIAFGDEDTIEAVIEICHIFPRRGRSAPRIGACFVDIDARTERIIERYVARLDREQVRLR